MTFLLTTFNEGMKRQICMDVLGNTGTLEYWKPEHWILILSPFESHLSQSALTQIADGFCRRSWKRCVQSPEKNYNINVRYG